MFIKQQETLECLKYNFKLEKKTLDTHHKTLYVMYLYKKHPLNVAVYSCVIPKEQQVAIVNSLLVKSYEIKKILMTSEQSLRVQSPRFTGLETIRVIHHHQIIVMDTTLSI